MFLFIGITILSVQSVISIQYLDHKITKRVINGEDVNMSSSPWVASIQGKRSLGIFSGNEYAYCGAALISDRWLLTAAHCFSPSMKKPKYWHLRLASSKLKPNIKERIVGLFHRLMNNSKKPRHYYHLKNIIIHHKYQDNVLEYDLALIKTKEIIPIEYMADAGPIQLPVGNEGTSWPFVSQVCHIAGWGCNIAGGPVLSNAQTANLAVVSPQECRQHYRSDINLTIDHEFCAGYLNRGVGVCPGDSGSALACQKNGQWVVAGITSAAHSLFPGDYPGIFTRVSAFRQWIDSTIEMYT